MKRFISVIIISLLMARMFAQEKIGTAHENTYYVNVINGKIPVTCYFENTEGFISTITNHYITIGSETFGPYERITHFIKNDNVYYKALNNDGWRIYKNGKSISDYYETINNFGISDDETIYFSFLKEGKEYVKKGDIEIQPPDLNYSIYSIQVDKDLIIYKNKEKLFNYYFYLKNKYYGPFSDVYNFEVTADGDLIFETSIDSKDYINTTSGIYVGPFLSTSIRAISPNKKNIAYKTSIINEDHLLIDTLWLNKNKIFEGKDVRYVTFIDENTLAFSYSENGKYYVQVGNKKYGPYDKINHIRFSHDKKQCAIVYSDTNNNIYLQVGKEIAGPFDDCDFILFSPDNSKIAYYIKERGKKKIMINNSEIDYNYLSYSDNLFTLFFSKDGKKFGYEVRDSDNKIHIVLKDFQSKPYDSIFLGIYSNDILFFTAKIDSIGYRKIILNSKEYIGYLSPTYYVYIDNGIIYKKNF